jgi:hypothetical protein
VIYDLVFTSERVIAVNVKHPKDVQSYPSLDFSNLFIGNWASRRKEQSEQAKISSERREAITKLTPDELLKLSAHNFEIKYSNIVSVEIDRGLIDTKLKFIIELAGQTKIKRDFTIKKQLIPETKQLLDKVLKSKIRE